MVIPLRDENPTRRSPVLTVALIAVNVVVFFVIQPNGFWTPSTDQFSASIQEAETQCFLYEHAAVPAEITDLEPLRAPDVADVCGRLGFDTSRIPGEPAFPGKSIALSVLFSMFMHGGLLHLGGNMLFLWIFGNNVEDRLGIVGYAAFYLFTGIVATLAHVAAGPDSVIPVIGASGAIAGVMGAYLVWWPHARILSIVPIFFIIQFVRLPAGLVLGLWFLMQFLTNPNSGVAWAAHVGGFVAGAVIGLVLRPRRQRPAPAVEWR